MTDEALRRAYQGRDPRRDPTPHPEPEALGALASGTLPEAQRLSLVDHLSQCAACRAEFELLDAIAKAETPARSVGALPRWLPLAAAVVLSIGALAWWRLGRPGADPVVRGEGQEIAIAAPTDSVLAAAAPLRFAWHPAAGVATYRLELVHLDGRLAYTVSGPDTSAQIPDSVVVAPGRYRWWVTGTTATGEIQSLARALEIR